ncbi:MAG: hypothetical protein P8X78_02000 [Nitrosopumilaceae archaeon]
MFLSLIVIFSTSQIVLAHPHEGQVLVDQHTHQPHTEYIPLNGLIGIEKTSLIFHAENDNSLPWAFVEGKIANPVAGYPVIIQIYQNDDAVHFAQTDVDENGNYEYKFRVLNVEEGKINKIFDGDYNVVIFKVVYSDQENLV